MAERSRRDVTLVDMLDLEPGDQALEVSVGMGVNLPLMCEKIGSSGRVFGLDISEGMLAQARNKLSSLPCVVELRQSLAEELSYPDNSSDALFHLGGINFFTSPRRALEEMDRVAGPGARIVVSDETVALVGGLRARLSRAILWLVPRLRPPTELVPDPHPQLRYLAGGYLFAMQRLINRSSARLTLQVAPHPLELLSGDLSPRVTLAKYVQRSLCTEARPCRRARSLPG